MRKPKIKIIGVGNRFRSDDAVGPIVADAVRPLLPSDVTVEEASGEGASLMDSWSGWDRVVIVDAVRSGAAPGTIFRLDAVETPIPSEFFHYSTHAFSVAEAIEMARVLRLLPRGLIVYGIEGLVYDNGQDLSEPVSIAAQDVISRIVAEIQTYSQQEVDHA